MASGVKSHRRVSYSVLTKALIVIDLIQIGITIVFTPVVTTVSNERSSEDDVARAAVTLRLVFSLAVKPHPFLSNRPSPSIAQYGRYRRHY